MLLMSVFEGYLEWCTIRTIRILHIIASRLDRMDISKLPILHHGLGRTVRLVV